MSIAFNTPILQGHTVATYYDNNHDGITDKASFVTLNPDVDPAKVDIHHIDNNIVSGTVELQSDSNFKWGKNSTATVSTPRTYDLDAALRIDHQDMVVRKYTLGDNAKFNADGAEPSNYIGSKVEGDGSVDGTLPDITGFTDYSVKSDGDNLTASFNFPSVVDQNSGTAVGQKFSVELGSSTESKWTSETWKDGKRISKSDIQKDSTPYVEHPGEFWRGHVGDTFHYIFKDFNPGKAWKSLHG